MVQRRKTNILQLKIILYKDGTLEVSQVNISDTGFYRCQAKYRSYTLESRQAYVKVFAPKEVSTTSAIKITKPSKPTPVFAQWPEDRSGQEHDEVIFECLGYNDAMLEIYSNTSSLYYTYKRICNSNRDEIFRSKSYKVAVKENDKQVWQSNEDSEPRRKLINGLLPPPADSNKTLVRKYVLKYGIGYPDSEIVRKSKLLYHQQSNTIFSVRIKAQGRK